VRKGQILPDTAKLVQLAEDGYTDREIADMYPPATRQAVSYRLSGVRQPRRAVHVREWPWDVQSRHKRGWLYESILYYRLAESKERPLTQREAERLASFRAMFDKLPGDWVVDYFPTTATGFKLRRRRPADRSGSLLAT
jgi:hypothetical protein